MSSLIKPNRPKLIVPTGPVGAAAAIGAGARRRMPNTARFGLGFANVYGFRCLDKYGRLKWEDWAENLVVTEGRDSVLDVYLAAGTQITTWYLGLTDDSPSIAAGDTLASHTGWVEAAGYTGDRQAITWGTPSSGSVDNSAAPNDFAITGTDTIGGAFVCDVATGTSGTLFGVAAFTGGDKAVDNGDTLEVTVTTALTSS